MEINLQGRFIKFQIGTQMLSPRPGYFSRIPAHINKNP